MFTWTAQHVNCNLCGADDPAVLFEQDQHGLGLHTVMCRKCGLIYLDPRPREQDYGEFYRHWYHRLYPARAAFHSGKLGARITAETARRRCQSYAALLQEDIRLLEVGPGEGAFLQALQSLHSGGRVRGVDLSPAEAEVCREKGLDVACGQLRDLSTAYSENTHVAMFHVLEHALDPLALLRQAADRLRPGGYLLVEVPNILGSWQGLGMLHLAHPYQFAPATLGRMLGRAGLEILHLEPLEIPLFHSSIRAVARLASTTLPLTLSEAPAVDAMRVLFARKLGHWQRDLFLSRLKRRGADLIGPRWSARLWERTAGRGWKSLLKHDRGPLSSGETPCALQ
jgi:2-polyprenyl-3-methyl-5-hydroxy-6-metoxy-1,4-benzoquinol methylase